MAQFFKAAGRELYFVLAQHQAARVRHFIFERRARNTARPVRRLHDHAHANFFTRPVDAAIREQIRRQLARVRTAAHAARIKAREINHAVAAVIRQERSVVGLARHIHRRGFLARETGEIRQARAPRRIGGLRCDHLAVATHDLYRRAHHRLARGDRLHKHILRTVDGALHHQPQIGDDDQPLVDRASSAFGFGVVAFHLDEEDAALAAVAIQIFS